MTPRDVAAPPPRTSSARPAEGEQSVEPSEKTVPQSAIDGVEAGPPRKAPPPPPDTGGRFSLQGAFQPVVNAWNSLPSAREAYESAKDMLPEPVEDFVEDAEDLASDVAGDAVDMAKDALDAAQNYLSQTPFGRFVGIHPPVREGAENVVINQGDYPQRMGRTRRSLASGGCFLATTTMAANWLTGSALDLNEANAAVTRANGFLGQSLVFERAAGTLGLDLVSRQRATPRYMETAMQAIRDGNLLAVGVDHTPRRQSSRVLNSGVDHFLLISGIGDDGRLYGIDPAGGREVAFSRQSNGSWTAPANIGTTGTYRLVEAAILRPRDQSTMLAAAPVDTTRTADDAPEESVIT